MTRPDGLTDFDDLSPEQKEQARALLARRATLDPSDAPLLAFRVTKGSYGVPAGIVSARRADLALSRRGEALGVNLGRAA